MKKCILFGVGSFFESNMELYPSDEYEVIGYGYSEPSLASSVSNNLKYNKPIFSPQEISVLQKKEQIYVFICSGPWSSYDIFITLRDYGVNVNLILFVDESKALGIHWKSRVNKKGNLITNVNGQDYIAILGENYGGLTTNITNIERYNSTFYSYFKYCNLFNCKNDELSNLYNKSITQIISEIEKKQQALDPKKIRIAIRSVGGLGDDITICRFIFAMKQSIPNTVIDFYSIHENNYKFFQYIDHNFNYSQFSFVKSFEYDLVLDGFIPVIYRSNSSKIKQLSPKLFEYCQYCNFIEKNFYASKENSKHFLQRDFTEYSLMISKKFSDRLDLQNIIADLSKIDFEFTISLDEADVLKKFGLRRKEYILFNRAVDELKPKHPKLWDIKKYSELAKQLKSSFGYPIVQIGHNDFYGIIENIDLNLLGKTNFEELKVLLKNSLILVACEGGLVHLNHCLNGKSAVLFGPTDKKYFGYDENINIEGRGCPFKCFDRALQWRERCILGYTPPKCIDSISVNDVFDELSAFISSYERNES